MKASEKQDFIFVSEEQIKDGNKNMTYNHTP